jgi:tetratricopeptide (TPR) repeat protein
LIAKGAYAEAIPILELAHKVEPEHGSVQYALAMSHARQGQFDQAAAFLERILARDPRWSDYDAWRLLIETQLDAGHYEQALEKARALVKISPTLRHKCILGEILIDQSYRGEARALLDKALEDHAFTPAPLRRHNRAWAKQAGKLLKRVTG